MTQTLKTNTYNGKKIYSVGTTLPNGRLVLPNSPDTGEGLSLVPVWLYSSQPVTWKEAHDIGRKLNTQGHENARLLSAEESRTSVFNGIILAGHNDQAKLNRTSHDKRSKVWTDTWEGRGNAAVLDLSSGAIAPHYIFSRTGALFVCDEPDMEGW